MLKTSSIKLAEPKRGVVGVSGSSRARSDGSELNGSEIDGGEVNGSEVGDNEVGKKVQKMSKSKSLSKFKKIIRSDFLTPKTRLAFTKLRQAFVKAPIFHYFDLKRYIRVEMNASGYAISRVFSQLTLDNLG